MCAKCSVSDSGGVLYVGAGSSDGDCTGFGNRPRTQASRLVLPHSFRRAGSWQAETTQNLQSTQSNESYP